MLSNNIIRQQLIHYGITDCCELIYNPSFEQLVREETNHNLTNLERGTITNSGAIAVNTGIFTGRSPLDKYIVCDNDTHHQLWWSDQDKTSNNQPISQITWQYLKKLVSKQLSYKRLFIIDVYCGAKKNSRLRVRFVTEVAWQAHFVKNMFIQPDAIDLISFEPEFIVLNGAKCTNPNWREQNMHSENFIALNLTEGMQLIAGTWYGGEMKKGLFTVMNYHLPLKGIASMHCSANVGINKDVALFFGLSGTGKTTLSHDTNRALIGDDEHGWDNDGIFNLEGGCYAKTINLKPELEPEIFQAIRCNALLENVMVRADGSVNYHDNSKTDNARVSYPLNHIKNRVQPVSCASHASTIIFLTADAFGVLPPVATLTNEQAQYYFLSGFSAKLSGTERGIISPVPTFSACFGAAFLALHPTVYAALLAKRMNIAGTNAYLVNTGWNGNGSRIALKDTKAIINAILNKQIQDTPTIKLPIFNLSIPQILIGVDSNILDPRTSYINSSEWQNKARSLAQLFIKNFNKFTLPLTCKKLHNAGPQL